MLTLVQLHPFTEQSANYIQGLTELFFGRTLLSNRHIVLAILLLAGDVHPNPGPINRETIYPCGK